MGGHRKQQWFPQHSQYLKVSGLKSFVYIKKKKPKEHPNSNMMGRFLRTEFVWVRRVNNACNFHPSRSLGDTCKAHLANPPKNFYDATAISQTAGAFCEAKFICCPKTFTMAEDPKANAAGEKCQKELRNWVTSLKK